MAKLTEVAMNDLFAELTAAMPDENKFNEVMINNAEKFRLPLYIKRAFIDVGRNSTINHQIARSTKDKFIECNKENNCSLCINDKEKMLGEDVGSAAYNLYEYINKHDKVKKKYRELFSESYKNTKNDGGYTPLAFAKTCKPEFAEFMTPVKSPRSSSFKEAVKNVASRSQKEFSNLVKRAASSKSKKETNQKNPPSAKDKDLTLDELLEKKAALEKQLPGITHTIITYGNTNSPGYVEQKKKDEKEAKKIAEIEKDIAILNKEIDKKTKKPSFFSRVRAFVKKGGKTRKHKKTNKRRTYRRK